MALTIIQQPQALTFVGNIPDLIAQTDGLGMTVNVSKGATLILAEYYTADEGGKARVALKDFLDDQLQLELPDPDTALFEQTKSWASFSVEIISGESTETISFVAIKGGSSTLNLDCPAYLLEAWLTWQPQIKKVKDIQPEWLSYFTQHAAVVKARGYFSGGTSEDVTLHTLDAGKHYTVNMTFADLREEFVLQPIYIDVWVENAPGGDPVFSTYRQRYVLSTEFFEFDDFFLFKNSVGGLDLIRFTGSRESTNPIEVDSALYYDEYQRDYQVTPSLAFEKNTGYFRSRAELLWSLDFFQAKEKYYQIEDAFTEIRLINPEFTAPENTLTSLDFKFSYTRQTIYLSLFKKKSPLIDPVIIGPGDDDYYLPPDIGEFPQKTDPSGLLFPVQQPGTPGWFFITWENMLAEILENIPSGNHNELDGLQGGNEEERFHLTEEQHDTAVGITRTLDEEGAADQYQFPTRVKGSPAESDDEFVTKSQLPNIQQYGRISGGTIQWSGVGLTYNFSRAVLAITGECIAESGQVTLDPADDTHPRFDGLGWRKIAEGIADRIKLTGDALPSPPFPQFNPETEVEGIFVSVPAEATEPPGVTTENVYLENTEWAVSFAGTGTGNEDSTVSPETDLYAIEVSAIKNAFKVILDRGSVLDLNTLSDPTFGMGQKLKAALANNQNFDLIFMDGSGAPASNLLQLSINKASLAYQFIGVNLAEFQWTTRLIRYIEIRYRQPGNGTFAGAFFDNIKIQGGVAQPPSGFDGDKGWSPVLAVISDGERRVHQIIDWTGGQGAKPITGLYIGIDGLKVNIADGINIRGAAGADGAPGADGVDGAPGADGMDGAPGADGVDGLNGWTPILAIVADGERRVHQVVGWTGGTGTEPTSGLYVGVDGLKVNITDGVDIRGAEGADGAPGADGADGTLLDPAIENGLNASLGDSPGTLNKYVTVSVLNSYSYVQEAPTDSKGYVRINSTWSQVSPYHLAQVGASDGQVLTWVAANNRYEPASLSGGSSLWTDQTTYISRNSKVVIGTDIQSSSSVQLFELKFRRSSVISNLPEIQIFDNEGNVLLNWGNSNPNYPVWSRPGFTIGATTGGGPYTFLHRSGLTAAFGGDAFVFQNASGEEILAGTHTRIIRLANPTLSIGTTVTSFAVLRHRSSLSNNGGVQFLIEDANAVSNFQVDNIGRGIFRGTMRSAGAGINRAPLGSGISIQGTNDGADAFQLYTQDGTTLVTFYRRTLGWVFRGFGTSNEVIQNLQDSTGAERFKYLANGRMFLYNIPTAVPTAGTKEVYVDGSGFLKLAV